MGSLYSQKKTCIWLIFYYIFSPKCRGKRKNRRNDCTDLHFLVEERRDLLHEEEDVSEGNILNFGPSRAKHGD